MDRKAFFDALKSPRGTMFARRLSQSQVDGINAILDAFVMSGDGRAKTLAYGLATARGEVGVDMAPVREGFRATDTAARGYVARLYGHKGPDWYCFPVGPYKLVYYGRGFAQLTWLENYRAAEADLGLPLVSDPDLALDPEVAGRVLFWGLISGRWNGRGKGIAHYLPDGGPDDLKNARRTVNVTDRWQKFAGFYREFLAAIEAAGGVPVAPDVPAAVVYPAPDPARDPVPVAVDPAPAPVPALSWRSVLAAIAAAFARLFVRASDPKEGKKT